MYLNETILQSKTTLSLVEYIDELWKFLDECDVEMSMSLDYTKLSQKYDEIKYKAERAKKKRNF